MYNVERVPVKHFKILKKYIKGMPEGPTKQRVLEEALKMIEDPSKVAYDDIEQSLFSNPPPGEERAALKERVLQAKLSRAGKLAKALTKS